MENYPIFVELKNQPCLVVGGGEVAHRKIRLLVSAGAKITVIAPDIDQSILGEFHNSITHIKKEYETGDIGNYRLITAATNDRTVNAKISADAQEKNILVNVVDDPRLCSFITPSIIDRSPVIVAISTGGSAPVLARTLRSKLESYIPNGYGVLAQSMKDIRNQVKNTISDEGQRRSFWEKIVEGSIAEKIFSGQVNEAKEDIEELLSNSSKHVRKGAVWLVGAGPGDPDLLTFRALRLMQQADVVLYDRLVSDKVLNLCRRDADRIYVGKRRADHTVDQQNINQLLVDLALEGKNVVRLKGGDPFIFGRGGEEMNLLTKNNVPFQIVPGITAASGCATYAGIPLTHRDHAQSCLFVTGHLKDGTVDLDWQQLSMPNQTVVIYMGLIGLPTITKRLIEHGVNPATDIALIEQGTMPQQRVITGSLETIVDKVKEKGVRAPTLIIIGSVVQLRNQLSS